MSNYGDEDFYYPIEAIVLWVFEARQHKPNCIDFMGDCNGCRVRAIDEATMALFKLTFL